MKVAGRFTPHDGIVPEEFLRENFGHLLTGSEEMEIGFGVKRDLMIFTNKRLILVETEQITGSKRRKYSFLFYRMISHFTLETSGILERNAELKIWMGGNGHHSVTKRISMDVDLFMIQAYLSEKMF